MIGRYSAGTPPLLALEGGDAQPLQYVSCIYATPSPSCQHAYKYIPIPESRQDNVERTHGFEDIT